MRVALLHQRTSRPHNPGFQEQLDKLNHCASSAVEHLGWEPILLASAEHPVETTLHAVEDAGLVVLMGGEDIHPSFYGGATNYSGSGEHEPTADEAHIQAVQTAVAHRIPVLGICRGHQILNVALGGDLQQHLPADNHRRNLGDKFVDVDIELDPRSIIAKAMGTSSTVRCGHHQTLGEVGQGLQVVARAADGGIEAIVHTTAPAVGVQWHPEHPATWTTQMTALLKAISEGANSQARAASASAVRGRN